MTRILVVTPVPGEAIDNGVSARTNGLVEALRDAVPVRVVRVTQGSALLPRLVAGARGLPPSSGRFADVSAQLERAVDEWRPDVVHADTLALTPALARLRPGVLRLASLNDSYGLFTEWAAAQAPSWPAKAEARLRAEVAERSERVATRCADLIHVVSAVDAVDLRSRGVRVPVDVVPNGVAQPMDRGAVTRAEHPVVVFHGALGGEHGLTALLMARGIWPAVRRQVPDAELHVVGSGASAQLTRELSGVPGVLVRGFADDLPAELRNAWVGVVPVAKPNGQSNKALDVLSAGTVLCADPAVAGGIPELRDDRNAVLAPVGRDFSEAVVRLLRDASLRDRLAAAGADVARGYTWARTRERYLESVVAALRRGAT